MAHAIEAHRVRIPQLTGALALALAARGNSNNSSGAAGSSASANTTVSVVPKPAAISAKNFVNPTLRFFFVDTFWTEQAVCAWR